VLQLRTVTCVAAAVESDFFKKRETEMKDGEQKGKNVLDCVRSLAEEAQKAGGDVGSVLRKAREMTVEEFILDVMANNHIRFAYVGEEIDRREDGDKEPSQYVIVSKKGRGRRYFNNAGGWALAVGFAKRFTSKVEASNEMSDSKFKPPQGWPTPKIVEFWKSE
jgi:hypothetical protein